MFDNFVPMEMTSSDHNMLSISLLLFFLQFFLIITRRFQCIAKFFPGYRSYVQSKLVFDSPSTRTEKPLKHLNAGVIEKAASHVNNVVDVDGRLRRDDVEMVMGKLGIFCSRDSEKLQESFSSCELSSLFEESEPSLEEVKEAFDVFDENRDGFIDAKELQRVLCILGLKEGSELENCKKMIKKYDINRDGRIDFDEFLKFMETTFC